jgi:hypothetical protein
MLKGIALKNRIDYSKYGEKIDRNEQLVMDYIGGMGPTEIIKKYWDQGVRNVSRVYQILGLYRQSKDKKSFITKGG